MQDIAKHLILGLSSYQLNNKERKLIKEINPLGFVFFDRNFSKPLANTTNQKQNPTNWIEDFKILLTELKEISKREQLIFSIDHEGGRVNRLPAPITSFPYAQSYKEQTKAVASKMAKELHSIGINLSFAPVLDIDLENRNSVISKRSFSSNAKEVAKCGIEFAKSLEQNSILSCAKHFPGHGATVKDSHFELPVNKKTYEELKKEELIPFISYIENDFSLIMTSHILFPKIDTELPATLSEKIINQILRKDLGYSDCIITDDLDMKALDKYKNKESLALNAGVDILLICGDDSLEKAKDCINKIDQEIDLSQSSKRIDKLISKLP